MDSVGWGFNQARHLYQGQEDAAISAGGDLNR